MNADLPNISYAGWAWGPAMAYTEMVIFSANGSTCSSVTAFKCFEKHHDVFPEPTLQPCYTTSYKQNTDGTVSLTASRPLDCGIEDSYVVQLDQELQLNVAWANTSPMMIYHGDDYIQFTGYLGSDGTCTATPSPTDPLCTKSLTNDAG